MPGIAGNKDSGEPCSPKASSSAARSSTTTAPLSPASHRDDEPAGPTIEQLYENVREIRSSGEASPAWSRSVASSDRESRVDSELRHLAIGRATGGEAGVAIAGATDESSSRKAGKAKSTKARTLGGAKQPSVSPRKPSKEAALRPESSGQASRIGKAAGGTRSRSTPARKPMISSSAAEGEDEVLSEAGVGGNPDLGRFLLKQARDLISSGESPHKALKLALRAATSFERSSGEKPGLELVMCLHFVAAIHCTMGDYDAAIPVLERSIGISGDGHHDQALARFSGYMQLGDTYAMAGQLEDSIRCYTSGLEVQKEALGEKDPMVGDTCRYIAEACSQAMRFDEAEKLCLMALEIHREGGTPGSSEETADRRLLGLICEAKGDHNSALEHLVLASMAMVSNGQEAEVGHTDCSIGDSYLSMARYDEAALAYQKALVVFKSAKGENHPAVASVFVRLADLCNKTGKLREAKSYCESALRIYEKSLAAGDHHPEEAASGLADIATVYESMNDQDQALKLLQKALSLYGSSGPGHQASVAGVEAQVGVLHYVSGDYAEAHRSLGSAISKLRAFVCGKKLAFLGIALNQMGLACSQLGRIDEAAEMFEEARGILEHEYGPYHKDTLRVCSNLAGVYDAMGRLDEAIKMLEHVVRVWEEKVGTASPELEDERRRLAELLKEAGRERNRGGRTLECLIGTGGVASGKKVSKA